MSEVKTISDPIELKMQLLAGKEEKLLRVRKVAELLDVSRQMVYRYVAEKHLVAIRLPSGGLRIKSSEVQRFIIALETHSKFGLQW